MSLLKRARKMVRRMVLGDTDLPQQCTVAMPDPQDEISVWLHGAGAPRDVTDAHAPACAAPFTIGIGVEDDPGESADLSLRFCERHGERRVLGEIGLRAAGIIRTNGGTNGHTLRLFQARSCRNHCLPWTRLWAHQLHQAYVQLRHGGDPDVRMDALGTRSMIVLFICPRPVVLVSAMHGECGNIFPMNLMGPIGRGYMAFALNSSRQAAPFVEQAGRAVFSNIPAEQTEVARQLRGNHRQKSVRWDQLPFETRPSALLGIPVPCFALRVREMEIEAVRQLGSHTLFVARVIHDECRSAGPQFTMIHGIYQARRLRMKQEQTANTISGVGPSCETSQCPLTLDVTPTCTSRDLSAVRA
jgi:flavin reductase (DIM6/NTAB) family NADH-FMN oxidoreductase RutF